MAKPKAAVAKKPKTHPPFAHMALTVAKPKAAVAKEPKTHPPFAHMIKEAIASLSLKEQTASSQYAISKYIEDHHKESLCCPLFKKNISLQLKRLVASGTLTKVKSSYKLSAPAKKEEEKKNAVAATRPVSKTKKRQEDIFLNYNAHKLFINKEFYSQYFMDHPKPPTNHISVEATIAGELAWANLSDSVRARWIDEFKNLQAQGLSISEY